MLVLTAPVEREWNDLAIHPLFVRFIAEAARYLVRGDASAASTTVGSVVLTGLTAAGGGQIFDPRGERVLGLAQTAAADRLIPDADGVLRDPRQRRRALGRRERRCARVGPDAAARVVRAALARDAGAEGRAERRSGRARRRMRSRVRSGPQCFGSPQRCCWPSCCWRIATLRSAGRRRNERSRATRNLSGLPAHPTAHTYLCARRGHRRRRRPGDHCVHGLDAATRRSLRPRSR